ncbi:Hemoglobin subunit alpha-2 [Liparis tanakae]|uniref:Hemoglobin subunit alpha-2 n=1 Tax=Liparis tanakae TaxID=230148 RepID=A0A4Z2I029_9TELE|nr:Hemoglobin subunit alpha-2 [Liparis tanakae]
MVLEKPGWDADQDLLLPLEGPEPHLSCCEEAGVTGMAGVAEAESKIDDLKGGLSGLSELHAFTLRVDPANFKILSHCILVVMAIMFPNEFTPEVQLAMDKFLAAVALALAEKYR